MVRAQAGWFVHPPSLMRERWYEFVEDLTETPMGVGSCITPRPLAVCGCGAYALYWRVAAPRAVLVGRDNGLLVRQGDTDGDG